MKLGCHIVMVGKVVEALGKWSEDEGTCHELGYYNEHATCIGHSPNSHGALEVEVAVRVAEVPVDHGVENAESIPCLRHVGKEEYGLACSFWSVGGKGRWEVDEVNKLVEAEVTEVPSSL